MGRGISDVDSGEETFEVKVFSFGFKYGAPRDGSMILDVRFLPNPYWEEALRPFTGKDPRIAEYVLNSESGSRFLDYLLPLLRFMVHENRVAGKKELCLGIGCTGGHHRSVAVVERIASELVGQGITVQVEHRDIERE